MVCKTKKKNTDWKQGHEHERERERSSNANLLLWDEITDTDKSTDCSVRHKSKSHRALIFYPNTTQTTLIVYSNKENEVDTALKTTSLHTPGERHALALPFSAARYWKKLLVFLQYDKILNDTTELIFLELVFFFGGGGVHKKNILILKICANHFLRVNDLWKTWTINFTRKQLMHLSVTIK